jgi:hypothetical protein
MPQDRVPKPPRPRIRRVFDARPLAELPRPLKVRPFVECFDRGSGVSGLLMQGQLNGDCFEVSIGDRERVVLRGSASQDAHGPFALLEAQEHPVGRGHALRVDADAQDADSNHAAISYFELTGDLVARQELAYSERWYSVYFNPLGLVDGSSSCAPRSIAAPARRLS